MAGPAAPVSATLVVVGAQVIEVLGARLRTADELLAFLAEHKIGRIELETVRDDDDEPDDGTPFYEIIGKIIYSTTRRGIEIVRVDDIQMPDSTFTPP